MKRPDYLTDTSHLLLLGPTGARTVYGGKTALATWLADGPLRERELVLFVNVKQDDVADVLEDYREVSTVREVGEAMGDGARRIVLTPNDPDWEAVSERVESFVRELPADMGKAVVLDEVPELDERAVLSFARVHGNGANCKLVAISQGATEVSQSVVNCCIPIWIGPKPGSYDAWFRSNDLGSHIEPLNAHEPYEWSVLLGPAAEDRDHFEPVDERYGEV